MMTGAMPRRVAIEDAPRTSSSAPATRKTSPTSSATKVHTFTPAGFHIQLGASGAPLTLALRGATEGAEIGSNLSRADGSRVASGRSLTRSVRSEEHTSELQSLMRISYAVFCLN